MKYSRGAASSISHLNLPKMGLSMLSWGGIIPYLERETTSHQNVRCNIWVVILICKLSCFSLLSDLIYHIRSATE